MIILKTNVAIFLTHFANKRMKYLEKLHTEFSTKFKEFVLRLLFRFESGNYKVYNDTVFVLILFKNKLACYLLEGKEITKCHFLAKNLLLIVFLMIIKAEKWFVRNVDMVCFS